VQNPGEPTDETLMAAMKIRKCGAFEELISRYQNRICSFATRVLRDPAAANDVTQETFLALYLKADTFISGYRVRPWLFKIAYNKCLDYIRQAGAVSSEEFEVVYSQSPEDSVAQQITGELLRTAVEGLRREERDAILLRHQSDLPYDQIAEIMGVPIGTVKTHLFRARHRRRDRLGELGTELRA
jgi:RNA polymerase sigma-70 factor (ECF subfamily)